MNLRALPRVAVPTAVALMMTLAACATESRDRSTPAPTTSPASSLAPTTSLMPDCGAMPTAAEVSAIVGVPLDEGTVTGAGLCQFTGVNDQSLAVLLQRLDVPGDRQSFLDLQASLGEPRRVTRSDLEGGLVGLDGTVWVDRDGVVQTAWVSVTGGPASSQTGAAADLLVAWLAG